ncbi:DUF6876 family protein [Teichococcus vastitatis]|uniref:DUF6876 domain-containing protein n=1 Tax=Teichococcus vastitatis TaxID=2307076 RepID=A0ABS9WDG0_9PROT|nr:DUF6876 family protein [Pseudoroseomonas vastitatis]MCI0756699.1 hypothetical protein [Pseudoroseomonas vastitatis]
MMKPDELRSHLAHFMGSECVYRHWMNKRVVLTEGVQWLCENAECLWLADICVSHQPDRRVARENFQVWHLRVNEADRSAVVTMTDGNSKRPIVEQQIPYTDFPLPEMVLWMEGDADYMVMMLPSER